MKKLVLFLFGLIIGAGLFAQEPFQLLVEPGKPVLAGDGDDFTTLVITARNSQGEIIPRMEGTVKIQVSSGFTDELEAKMESGFAMVKYTSPMFGTPIKSSQRMIYFSFRFMQKFMDKFTGSDDYAENQKLATGIALETMREGLNPITLTPQKKGDNFVYIVCEFNDVKGKAKIEISEAKDGRNGNIIPGIYYGKDITGQSDWMLDITRGGEGTFGEASGRESSLILFSNEDFAEFDDAMGNIAGITGFKKAYIGPPASELKYYENFNIRQMGLPSAYMVMPNNGVFTYIPPILFEYAGQKSSVKSSSRTEEIVKTEKTGIVFTQNKIVGDGRSRTRAMFHFENEKGRPVAGKAVSWEIPTGIKVISKESVTNAYGNAVVELEAPLLKAGEEKRGENTGEIIDNYNLYQIKANYVSLSEKTETTQSNLLVYRTIEQDIYILKPGMMDDPYRVLLPQLEYYNLESSIYSLLPENPMFTANKKTAVNDAMILLASTDFDKSEFEKLHKLFFRNDREMFQQLISNEKGGHTAITDASGRFKMVIYDFKGKQQRLFKGEHERTIQLEPLESRISDLTGRHTGVLIDVLDLLSGGDAGVAAASAAGESGAHQKILAIDFKQNVLLKVLNMEKEICTGSHFQSLCLEEKLHITGKLITNMNGSARFVRDCAKEFGTQTYEALKFLMFYALEKFKFNEKVYSLMKEKGAGINAPEYFNSFLGSLTQDEAQRAIVHDFIMEIISKVKDLPSPEYYKLLGNAANYALTEKQKQLLDVLVDVAVKYLPFPNAIGDHLIREFYAGQTVEVLKLLDQDPEKIHSVYEQLHPAINDRSADIRQNYLNVAAWRLNLDNFKAYTDLTADLVLKTVVVLADIKSGNVAKIKDHWEYIEKVKNVLNAAYHAASVGNELCSFRNLWAESDAVLIYANKCIEQGSVTSTACNTGISFSLFPSAYASESFNTALNISGIQVPMMKADQLRLNNGRLPVNEMNQIYNSFPGFSKWFSENETALHWLIIESSEKAAALFDAAGKYKDGLELLTYLAGAVHSSPGNPQLESMWNDESEKFAATLASVAGSSGEAAAVLNRMEADPKVNLLPAPKRDLPVIPKTRILDFLDNELLKYGIIGGGGLILLLLIILLVRRRKRRSGKAAKAVQPQVTAPRAVSPPPPPPRSQPAAQEPVRKPPVQASSPRFCIKCGNPLKPNTKFCNKCGNPV